MVFIEKQPNNVCLQCGQSRVEVRTEKTFCATVTGYEYVETRDEWSRHHWRDWFDKELDSFGLHPSLWDTNRRTDFYDLEWPARDAHCMTKGHIYSELTDDNIEVLQGTENICMCCYESKDKKNND